MSRRSVDNVRAIIGRPRAVIMGILNVTPDSFSDGGRFAETDASLRHALKIIDQGADIIDVGGESTRPGASRVTEHEELERVIPIIERLAAATDVPISIDSHKPAVMLAAVDAGATMINDINGLRSDGALEAVASANVPVCIMHMQGEPQSMQLSPDYDDVALEVFTFLRERVEACVAKGVDRTDLIVDPGIGFGKTLEKNLALLAAVDELREFTACHVLIGVSRKSLIDKLFSRPLNQRLPASLGLAVQAVLMGAKVVRVHDVRETYDAVRSVEAVLAANLNHTKNN